jgi:prevent-host-death family protein
MVQRALDDGPRVVARHGTEVVVIVAAAEYRRLVEPRPDFKAFLLSGPDFSLLDLDRSPELPREVSL